MEPTAWFRSSNLSTQHQLLFILKLSFPLIPQKTYFSVSDLKNASFSILLHPQSQNIFFFAGTDPGSFYPTHLNSPISEGNNWTDEAARTVTLRGLGPHHMPQDTLIL